MMRTKNKYVFLCGYKYTCKFGLRTTRNIITNNMKGGEREREKKNKQRKCAEWVIVMNVHGDGMKKDVVYCLMTSV